MLHGVRERNGPAFGGGGRERGKAIFGLAAEKVTSRLQGFTWAHQYTTVQYCQCLFCEAINSSCLDSVVMLVRAASCAGTKLAAHES